jgi:NADH-quinone oxidoreductase subunit N
LFIIVSLGSIVIGSFGALKQTRIKRFLAYTSISQVGFILLGITSGSILGLFASLLYLFIYLVMVLMFFSIFLNIEHIILKKNIVYLSDLYGIYFYTQEASKYLAITIFSMAGLPPLGGFIGKLFLYFAVIEARLDFILIAILAISLISTYYYIKKLELTLFLRFSSFILITFSIFLPIYINHFLKLTFSCA